MIYPILWFTDGIADLEDDNTISLLQTAVHTPEMARSLLYPTMLVIGVLLVITSIVFAVRKLVAEVKPPTHIIIVFIISDYSSPPPLQWFTQLQRWERSQFQKQDMAMEHSHMNTLKK